MKLFFRHTLSMACLLLALTEVHAEYNGWYISFKITTQKHQEVIGHFYMAEHYFSPDSSTNQHAVLRILDAHWDGINDTLQFFNHRISYTYPSSDSIDSYLVYGLLDSASLLLSAVKSIEILDMVDASYLVWLSGPRTIADTIWTQKPAEMRLNPIGYLCSYDIFIHEVTPTTYKIAAELAAMEVVYAEKEISLRDEIENSDGEVHREAEEQLMMLIEQLDEEIGKILEEYSGEKVVIVSFCSC